MAYKVFQNGFPLLASEINTNLMNQSVMVFPNSSSRASTLTSPTEGMVTYLEDTNVLEVYTGAAWVNVNDNTAAIPKSTVTTAGDLIVATGNAAVTRLGVGSNGQVLGSDGTTATWVTPSADVPLSTVTTAGDLIVGTGSGAVTRLGIGTSGQVLASNGTAAVWQNAAADAMISLGSATLTGTSVTISSIPNTYNRLIVQIRDVTVGTASRAVCMRFNGDSTNYRAAFSNDSPTALTVTQNEIVIAGNISTTTARSNFDITIPNYTATGAGKGCYFFTYHADDTTSTSIRLRSGFGYYNDSNAISSITILLSGSGNFTAGEVEVYGIKAA